MVSPSVVELQVLIQRIEQCPSNLLLANYSLFPHAPNALERTNSQFRCLVQSVDARIVVENISPKIHTEVRLRSMTRCTIG